MAGLRIFDGCTAWGLVALMVCAGTLQAQVRQSVGIGSPGQLTSVGSSGPSYSFGLSSYGIGSSSSAAPTSDILRSSINAPGGFSYTKPATALGGGAEYD